MGSQKANCDLTIPGLNPFANIVTTPSPSANPYEFGGPGTTPILGSSEAAAAAHGGFGGFGIGIEQTSEHETRGGGGSRAASPSPLHFDEHQHRLTPSKVPPPRPPSPASGTMAPKPTPVSSPAPGSMMTPRQEQTTAAIDVFGDFPFDADPAVSPRPSPPPPSNLAFTGSPDMSVRTTTTSGSAFDDLNATVKAVLGGAKGHPVAAATNMQQQHQQQPPHSTSAFPASSHVSGFQSPGGQAFGFGSPNKTVPGDLIFVLVSSLFQSRQLMSDIPLFSYACPFLFFCPPPPLGLLRLF